MFSMNTVSLQRFSRLFVAATLLSIVSVALLFTQAHGHVGEENPKIDVAPSSTSAEVEQGATANGSLTISNSGKDLLSFTVSATTAADCSGVGAMSEPWLVVADGRGSVKPGESMDVSFSMIGAFPGEYNGRLCVASNDPEREMVEVPVTLVVTGDDDGEEPGPGPGPGDRWDAVKEWLREMIERLKELLRRLG